MDVDMDVIDVDMDTMDVEMDAHLLSELSKLSRSLSPVYTS